MPSRQVNVQFESKIDQLPIFSNVALVNTISDDVIIGFGFVDPVDLARFSHDEVPTVEAKTIVRIAMSKDNAKRLLGALGDALAKMEEVSDAAEPK